MCEPKFIVSIFCKAGLPPSNTYSLDLIESSTSRILLINLFSVFGCVQCEKNLLYQGKRPLSRNLGVLLEIQVNCLQARSQYIKQQCWMNLGGQIHPTNLMKVKRIATQQTLGYITKLLNKQRGDEKSATSHIIVAEAPLTSKSSRFNENQNDQCDYSGQCK